jgi:hypothetical protein
MIAAPSTHRSTDDVSTGTVRRPKDAPTISPEIIML